MRKDKPIDAQFFKEKEARTQIADIVKAARLRARLTQAELARQAETTQTVISRIESGSDSRIPSLALLAKIAEACSAKLTYGFRYHA